jgi:hypothetical protein
MFAVGRRCAASSLTRLLAQKRRFYPRKLRECDVLWIITSIVDFCVCITFAFSVYYYTWTFEWDSRVDSSV